MHSNLTKFAFGTGAVLIPGLLIILAVVVFTDNDDETIVAGTNSIEPTGQVVENETAPEGDEDKELEAKSNSTNVSEVAPGSDAKELDETSSDTTTEQATPTQEPLPVVREPGSFSAPSLQIAIAVESRVGDVSQKELSDFVFATLNTPTSWGRAGFSFVEDPNSSLKLVLAEGAEVDRLCLPLKTYGTVSCQNGAVVALNATRWREATGSWDNSLELYRTYLVNHEVGHLIGQRHPTPRCPKAGAPAAVMEQQTGGLEGCTGNGTPRDWEISYALSRPAKIAPLPSWQPDPRPKNLE